MVQHMISALSSAGCPVDITRHLSCEMCQKGTEIEHAGGYDPSLNQVFICCNNANSAGGVHGALVRNLLQMFDACVNKIGYCNPPCYTFLESLGPGKITAQRLCKE